MLHPLKIKKEFNLRILCAAFCPFFFFGSSSVESVAIKIISQINKERERDIQNSQSPNLMHCLQLPQVQIIFDMFFHPSQVDFARTSGAGNSR